MKHVSYVVWLTVLVPSFVTAQQPRQLLPIAEVLPEASTFGEMAQPCGQYFLQGGEESAYTILVIVGVKAGGEVEGVILDPNAITLHIDEGKVVPELQQVGPLRGILTLSSSELARSLCLPRVARSIRSPERRLVKLDAEVVGVIEGLDSCSEYFMTTVLGSSDGRVRIVALAQLDSVSTQGLHLLPEKYDIRLDSLRVVPTIEMVLGIVGTQSAILRISPEEYEKAPCLPIPNSSRPM